MKVLKRIDYEELGFFDASKIIKKHKKEADVWILLFLVFVNTICVNMCIAVCYSFFFKYQDLYAEDNGKIVYAQKLPVIIVTPFEMVTRTSFILHFVFEILPLDIYAWMIVGLDGLFTSLMSCIAAHFCVLQEALRTIRPRCLKRLFLANNENTIYDSNQLNAEMLEEMKKCILHLQMLIKSSAILEKIYNIQTCGQVMVSLFEMCFCLYLLTSSLDADVGSELTYLVSTSFELLLYCWFGNGVTEASVAIPDAIFKGDWLSSSREFKSCMLITMIRMRRPIYMTIGKFTPLTFTVFLSIGRAAYSFFTVLKSSSF
ncbi:PREDICTED: putative odorant receptor 92a [Nicrophorus vespilloides]|uniref:Odorant receptor 92a n=1 Tax=Nicrophorus vespilloides TaxID=110193 RepID=A0ABM1MYZ2_NICVS|nr:PREDICTED: putative odorant receptor 92a [Nicrophorus vespilloides]